MANEKRLIDADELIAFVERTCCNGCKNYEGARCRSCEHDDVMAMIEDAPTVDAVEVVRCKDCIHWDSETGWCNQNSAFDDHDMDWNIYNDYDFCSYGERR